MNYEHNVMAFDAGAALLAQLRSGQAAWTGGHLSAAVNHWPGMVDWPIPDKIFEDDAHATLAVEFKPPGHSKREYVTGLGQCLTYLRNFRFCALVLPEKSVDGYPVAEYLASVLNEDCARTLPIALLSYSQSPGTLTPVIALRPRIGRLPEFTETRRLTFWAYVRDASPADVFDILAKMDSDNCNFTQGYSAFWNSKRATGLSLTLDGKRRQAKAHRFSERQAGDVAERTNVNLLMRHTGLIDSEGRSTEWGYHLLRHGKVYTPASQSFVQRFGNRLLTVGKHLDLILWTDRHQRRMPAHEKQNHEQFKHALDEGLVRDGYIRAAPKNAAKPTYIRDEPKYWNALGLMETAANSYFHPGAGYVFNWRAILSMVNADL